MRSIILIICVFFFSSFSLNEKKDVGCLELDILLIADLSGSVDGHELFIRDALKAFVERFELSENGIKIGYIKFSGYAELENRLTVDKDDLLRSINRIDSSSTGSSTNLTHAFHLTMNEFMSNGRPNVGKIVILISDGDPDSEESAMESATLLKTMPGTSICGVFVAASGGKKEFMKELSSSFCYVESNFENLIVELKKMDICL